MSCQAEMCPNWTGHGCICEVLDIEPPRPICPGCGDQHDGSCQCEITHHCHHGPHPCLKKASQQIHFHAIDHCNEPELGEFGNYVFLLCAPCLDTLASNVEAHLKRLNEFGRAHCLSCGAPVAQIDHVIREIQAI